MKRYKTKPLHKGQRRVANDIICCDAKYNAIRCSRQFGKTYLGEQLLIYFSINKPLNKTETGKCVNMWVSPTYAQAKKVFKSVSYAIAGTKLMRSAHKSDLIITLSNGVEMHFKGVDKPDNIRGASVSYMFCDEFAFYKTEAWNEVLRPMMNVQGIRAFFFSTPKGKHNDFYAIDMSKGDKYSSHYGNYKENPYYDISEVEDAKMRLPSAIFKQEYEGEYIDDGGQVFENIKKNCTITEWEEYDSNKSYYAGIDWGRKSDKSVLTIVDNTGKIVYISAMVHTTWEYIYTSFAIDLERYNAYCMAECNSIGDVLNEALRNNYSNVEDFLTTNHSKNKIILQTNLSFNANVLQIPTIEFYPDVFDECSIFEMNQGGTGVIKYSAPSGMHDDHVMSLCIANHVRYDNAPNGIEYNHGRYTNEETVTINNMF